MLSDWLKTKGWSESGGWWMPPNGRDPYKARCYHHAEAVQTETEALGTDAASVLSHLKMEGS